MPEVLSLIVQNAFGFKQIAGSSIGAAYDELNAVYSQMKLVWEVHQTLLQQQQQVIRETRTDSSIWCINGYTNHLY